MAAGEHEPQRVVADDLGGTGIPQRHRFRLLSGPSGLPADQVDCPPFRGDRQPGARVVRYAFAWPPFQRPYDGVLDGVLGQVDVAGDADQRGQHARPLGAYQPLGRVTGSHRQIPREGWTGRISTVPYRTAGIFAATAIASSRSAHSSRKKPVSASLVSAYGPSLTIGSPASPPGTRTQVAVAVVYS